MNLILIGETEEGSRITWDQKEAPADWHRPQEVEERESQRGSEATREEQVIHGKEEAERSRYCWLNTFAL